MFFLSIRHFLFSFLWLSLGFPILIFAANCGPDRRAQNSHKSRVCFFYHHAFFHFHSFRCPLGSQFGSWQQKCDPDRRAQNSHKNRLCFFTHQAFSIFIPLAVPWGPNSDPCSKSVILTGARKIHIKVVYVSVLIRHFPFSFLWLSLDVPTWLLAARMWS